MPPVKKTPSSPAPFNVHMLKAAPAPAPSKVQPPDDWMLEGQFGHMAFEAGEGGRLVRLADVLRWLQSSQEIPHTDALQVLCDRMPAEVMGWLYWLQPTARATPVPTAHQFGYSTAEQIAARKEKDRRDAIQQGLERERQYGRFGTPLTTQNGRISFGYPEPTEPGLPALLKYLRGWWALPRKKRLSTCDILDDPELPTLTRMAIRLDKAHELWGYGSVVSSVALVVTAAPELPLRMSGSAWSDEQHAHLLSEYEATPGQTELTKRKALGVKWGMKADNVKKQVDIARKRAKEKVEAERASRLFPGPANANR